MMYTAALAYRRDVIERRHCTKRNTATIASFGPSMAMQPPSRLRDEVARSAQEQEPRGAVLVVALNVANLVAVH